MRRIAVEYTGGDPSEIQRKILESIQTYEDGKENAGRPGNSSGDRSLAESRRLKREEEHQRRLRRQCFLLGTVAVILLILLLMQKAADRHFSGGEETFLSW